MSSRQAAITISLVKDNTIHNGLLALMSNPNDGEQGQVKETKKCLYCEGLMSESDMPGGPPDTKGFVCRECGFVSFFVGTHMGHYYGVDMFKDRKGLSFYRKVENP